MSRQTTALAAVYELLHDARPVLLNLGSAGIDIAPWADHVKRVDGTLRWGVEPFRRSVKSAPSAVLIRPDGHVAWVGGRTADGLGRSAHEMAWSRGLGRELVSAATPSIRLRFCTAAPEAPLPRLS